MIIGVSRTTLLYPNRILNPSPPTSLLPFFRALGLVLYEIFTG